MVIVTGKKTTHTKKRRSRNNHTKPIFLLYVLESTDRKRTYVGVTKNLTKRIRQHNGELRGGAKATRGNRWRIAAVINGFPSDHIALSIEKSIHNLGKRLVKTPVGQGPHAIFERRMHSITTLLATKTNITGQLTISILV